MNNQNNEMPKEENAFNHEDFPSLDLAYPIALKSYEISQSRFDSLDSRIQTLLALGITLTAAIPLLSKFDTPNFDSFWFYSSVILFLIATVLGVISRLLGGVKYIHPQELFNYSLTSSEAEFKKDAIYWAGMHFETNKKILDKKHLLASIAMISFFLEVPALVVWVVSQNV